VSGDFRAGAALQFALALCRSDHYASNPALQRNRNDYIADDAVDLADALISRLSIQPEHNAASSNICTIEFPKAR
jgi:hypothetical protein